MKKPVPLTRLDVTIIVIILVVVLGVTAGVVAWDLTKQSSSSSSTPTDHVLHIVNNGNTNPLILSAQIFPTQPIWVKFDGDGTLGEPVYGDTNQNPPNYQHITLQPSQWIKLHIPPRLLNPWRITALTTLDTKEPPKNLLVECGTDRVCNMSAVDGVNQLLKMTLSVKHGDTIIDFKQNPCPSDQPCYNLNRDGQFFEGKDASSAPCPFGTCNLVGESLAWCNAIHTDQCANSSSTWGEYSRAESCETHIPQFTTYCYSHDDRNSSPVLVTPYNLKLEYRNL